MILVAEDGDFEALAKGDLVRGRPVAEGGIAPPPVMDMLRGLAARVRPVCDPAAWWIIENDEIVGLCSIVAVPTQAAVIDIGYGVADSRKGQGAATRAVGEVLAWARENPGLRTVTAETSVTNPASQKVLERNGFARIGSRVDDEDGDLICWSVSVLG